jgi:titin
MKNIKKTKYAQPTARTLPMSLGLLCVILLLAFAPVANAQNVTQLNTPTTTTLWAGTQDWNVFGLSSVTAPTAGVILQGTAISAFTGKPVRHMWYGDASNGLCRVDPEVDDPTASTTPGIGFHNNIERTCVGFIQAGGFVPFQLTFDASTNTLYAADQPRTANGVIRLHYEPSGDSGHGTIDPIHVESLMGAQGTRNGAGGCPVVVDPRTGATPVQMFAATLGPDGSLYVGWARNGTIARINHPDTFDPSSDADCASIQVPIYASDARLGAGGAAGHTFGLAWIGHTLFGADNISPWFKDNADQCLTPANGNQVCGPVVGIGTEILGTFAPGPQAGLVSDFTYNGPNTTFPGNTLFASSLGSTVRVTNASDVNNLTVTPQFGGTFCFITGVTIDTSNLANETVYVGSDCTQGTINGAGAIWQITPQPPAGAPPATPTAIQVTNVTPAGALTGSAIVSWIPGSNGQQLSSFVVHTVLASDGTTPAIADTPVPAAANGIPPNSVQVVGLPLGVAVEFQVAAANSFGTSQFSILSAAITPQTPVPPSAPTGVVATPGNASAQVAWSAPSSNGGQPITSYTVTAQICNPGCASAGNVTVPASQTGLNFTGLLNGATYNFIVFATTSAGNSPASLPSNAVIPSVPDSQDIAIAMTGSSSLNAGSFATFTMTVNNNGPGDAPSVTLADNLPAPFVSATTTQGVCTIAGTLFSCTLGGMHAGTSATVKVTVAMGASAITNSATITLRDLLGNVKNTDPNTANNTASFHTGINSGTGNLSADLQVVGSSNNGGPAIGSNVLFTWQVKNNTGNVTAPNVTFEINLPASFNLVPGSLSTSIGGCSINGQTLDCTTPTLTNGPTMLITYSVTPTLAGSFTSTGTVTSGATNPNPAHATFPVTIQPK